jgi:murein DD-endopeptidase MepM/ murein hydrolase activator NlpD
MQQNNQKPYNKSSQKSKLSILTQNLLPNLRKIKLRWLLLVLLVPLFGVLAVFGNASNGSEANANHHVTVNTVVEEVTLPLPIDTVNHNEVFWQLDSVRSDDTLYTLFKRMNIRDEDAIKYLMLAPEAHALNRELIPGHKLEIKTNLGGKLLHLEYELDNETILVAGLTPQGYQLATQKLILQNHHILKSAVITNSLFGATDDAGIPDQIALQIADIFSGQIDFQGDLRPDDHFNVIYEAFYNAGELMKVGNVLAVEFVNKGKSYQAVHFGDAEGKFAYYTPDGISLHKSFLRSPVEFTRVSSSFSTGRLHPILNTMRAHQGVDLAAPTGTRVKASGDGVVDFVGRKGGYGNVIILKHEGGISTVYGHLSGFAAGLHKGQQVLQSDIIGYVGMTGLATGPHLHYEFLIAGKHHDPLTVALPTVIPIDTKYQQAFDKMSLDYMAQIEMLNRSQMATKD